MSLCGAVNVLRIELSHMTLIFKSVFNSFCPQITVVTSVCKFWKDVLIFKSLSFMVLLKR